MTVFSVNGVATSPEPLSRMEIEQLFRQEFEKSFANVRMKDRKGKKLMTGRKRGGVFNPIVSFTGTLEIQTKENKARFCFDGKTHTNGWFWFTFLAFLFLFFPLLLVLVATYSSQNKNLLTGLEQVGDRVRFLTSEW